MLPSAFYLDPFKMHNSPKEKELAPSPPSGEAAKAQSRYETCTEQVWNTSHLVLVMFLANRTLPPFSRPTTRQAPPLSPFSRWRRSLLHEAAWANPRELTWKPGFSHCHNFHYHILSLEINILSSSKSTGVPCLTILLHNPPGTEMPKAVPLVDTPVDKKETHTEWLGIIGEDEQKQTKQTQKQNTPSTPELPFVSEKRPRKTDFDFLNLPLIYSTRGKSMLK